MCPCDLLKSVSNIKLDERRQHGKDQGVLETLYARRKQGMLLHPTNSLILFKLFMSNHLGGEGKEVSIIVLDNVVVIDDQKRAAEPDGCMLL